MVYTILIGVGLGGCLASVSRKGTGALAQRRDPSEAGGGGFVTPATSGCKGVSGIEHDIVFEGASALPLTARSQLEFCWLP